MSRREAPANGAMQGRLTNLSLPATSGGAPSLIASRAVPPDKDPFDVVRSLYAALNAGDPDGVAACYDERCFVEAGADRFGTLPPGQRFDVLRIAGMETGWGWVRAEWRRVRSGVDEAVVEDAGYSDFWVEGGLIRRHRTVAGSPVRDGGRTGQARPAVGVGAVILIDDGVVLVKRRHEPLAGQWSLPGGALELGETLEAGVAREVGEETGLTVDVGPLVEVFDRILLDEAGHVRFHFVIADYLCARREGRLRAGGDVDDVVVASLAGLDAYRLTEKAREVIEQGVRLSSGWSPAPGGGPERPGFRDD
jgi:ADP-ribose pyrophosphatase YjhB (NUDIX family)